MYTISSLKKALERPERVLHELNRLYQQGVGFRESPGHYEGGINILSADWDQLIILDACRFDVFESISADLDGELSKVESKASATHQFLRANFSNESLHDTVYVTANPQLYRIENEIRDVDSIDVSFHDQIEVWQNNWHEKHRTVMPEKVTNSAIEAAKNYPQKRLIVHYLQPHAPYIGPTGVEELPTEHLNFWGRFQKGEFDLSLDTIRRAYRENVQILVPHISKLLSSLQGKTVVTSDHGELLGERDAPIPIRRYGHPSYANISELIEIPWFVNESGSRPEIVPEPPIDVHENENIDDKVVDKRLQDLGYTE